MQTTPLIKRLLQATTSIWQGYVEHPFVQGIGKGDLDRAKFQFYLVQDYLYLFEYAKVFALGVSKATDAETMRQFAKSTHSILEGEMNLHRAYMQRLGISQEQAEHTPMALSNRSYTAYMLAVAGAEDAKAVAIAILSCALSYEYIAKRLLQQYPKADEHPWYGEWVAGYASKAYADENRNIEALVERLTQGISEAEQAHLEEIFVACSRYEYAFWDMAWKMEM